MKKSSIYAGLKSMDFKLKRPQKPENSNLKKKTTGNLQTNDWEKKRFFRKQAWSTVEAGSQNKKSLQHGTTSREPLSSKKTYQAKTRTREPKRQAAMITGNTKTKMTGKLTAYKVKQFDLKEPRVKLKGNET